MKKIVAFVLVMVTILSVSINAFAEESDKIFVEDEFYNDVVEGFYDYLCNLKEEDETIKSFMVCYGPSGIKISKTATVYMISVIVRYIDDDGEMIKLDYDFKVYSNKSWTGHVEMINSDGIVEDSAVDCGDDIFDLF